MKKLTSISLLLLEVLTATAQYNGNEIEKYKKTHSWYQIPLSIGELGKCLECCICGQYSYWYFPTFTYVGNDSIFWEEQQDGYLGQVKTIYHCSALSKEMKENSTFKYHFNVFKDSLNYRRPHISESDYKTQNLSSELVYLAKVAKLAPYGFVGKRSWRIEYRNLTLSMEYFNTNKKTIKYIDLFWQTKNDVGDVRNRGSFKATGPLKQWESASWDWNNTSHYVAGDVTSFWVTKMVITYMDGTKKILSEKQIVYDSKN